MGYLGMVGGRNPCLEFVSAPDVDSNTSFEDSPYGFAWGPVGSPPLTLIPYLINAATLEVEFRPDLALTSSGQPVIVLDDSTVIAVFHDTTSPYVSQLYAITRSGIAIAVSGSQQAVLRNSAAEAVFCRIDSSHFVRSYVPSPGTSTVVETFSVSGGTISLVATDTISTSHTVTNEGTGTATVDVGLEFFPFHYDGAGTLYAFMEAVFTVGGSTHQAIVAAPYSTGGGIGTLGLGTRARDAVNIQAPKIGAAKIGSSECCLFRVSGGERVPFYDDGTMHFTTASTSTWRIFSHVTHGTTDDQETTQGDYLTGSFSDVEVGATVFGPGLISQSGESLSYTSIAPVFLCQSITGVLIGGARHGSNLGAVVRENPYVPGEGTVFAYRW